MNKPIAIASDHGGYDLKCQIAAHLQACGMTVLDLVAALYLSIILTMLPSWWRRLSPAKLNAISFAAPASASSRRTAAGYPLRACA